VALDVHWVPSVIDPQQADEVYAMSVPLQEEQSVNDSKLARQLEEQQQLVGSPIHSGSVDVISVVNGSGDIDGDNAAAAAAADMTANDAILAAELQRQFDSESLATANHPRSRVSQHNSRSRRVHPPARSTAEGDHLRYPWGSLAQRVWNSHTPRREQQMLDDDDTLGNMLFGPAFRRDHQGFQLGLHGLLMGNQRIHLGDSAGSDYEALWNIAEQIGEVHHRGLSTDEINTLPTSHFTAKPASSSTTTTPASDDSADTKCLVCLEYFVTNDRLRTLPCLHRFHSHCIDEWIKRNGVCPVCRVGLRDQIDSQYN
jgi:E3 ubiquitin-protein ligase RNF38/44